MKIISWKNLTRSFVGFVLVSLVCLLVTTVYIQRRKAYQQILSVNAKDNSTQLPFKQEALISHSRKNIRFLQNVQNIRSLENFRTSVFAATSGGLLEFAYDGSLLNSFSVLDGLSESDLISLAVFQNKLFIGTRSKGLVTFDGKKFTKFIFPNRDIQAVTALKATPRKLLVGTFNGGLISFDGEKFTEIKANNNERIYKINNINKIGEQLFIGTFDNGMWLINGEISKQHFTKTEGLLSDRIIGITQVGKEIFVGTDLGISKADITELYEISENDNKKFQTQKVLPSLSGLTSLDKKLFFTKANGELFLLDPNAKNSAHNIVWEDSGKLLETSLLQLKDKLFLTSNQGAFLIQTNSEHLILLNKFDKLTVEDSLSDNTISAIAIDKNENLWLGTFRNGIDIYNLQGKKLKHIESEKISNINFLQSGKNETIAATSQGVFQIDKDFQIADLTELKTLPSKSVMQISHNIYDSTAIATSRGLYIEKFGHDRGYSTVQGLPSNNIFTTLQTEQTTYVGTLGGLAKIENSKVIRVYKDSNSALEANWITALIQTDKRIFIGTYGGGVFELLHSGDLRKFSQETGKFFVNPNAMFSDGERLYIGTLNGVRILNLQNEKWSNLKDALPSETVLSIAGKNNKIYFGTTSGVAIIDSDYFR